MLVKIEMNAKSRVSPDLDLTKKKKIQVDQIFTMNKNYFSP